MHTLENILNDIEYDNLPLNWNNFDIIKFSKDKSLWDYQQNALKNAIKALHKYYEDFADFQTGEDFSANKIRRHKLYELYKNNNADEDLTVLDIKTAKLKRNILNLLDDYYITDTKKIPAENFINQMSFWMATGSGKSLVLIKLVQILKQLMERQEIPANDILVLTYREDLITQLKEHIDEFNQLNYDLHINLRELKEYSEVKRETPSLFKNNEITVFYYRSDNLNSVHKDKIVDFRNYDDNGKWYILLDEAHKGDKDDSKRQFIYSIMARNGFLFNFSATFADNRDILTTAFNFNLERFINNGYGKHICLMKQEIRAFREKEDYSQNEKKLIVLQSLILLAYIKKFYEKIRKIDGQIYHNPLLLTLVNSVNTTDSDLKLFFRELKKIADGEISDIFFNKAKDNLLAEFDENPCFMFESEQVGIKKEILNDVSIEDIFKYVFNSKSKGAIEIIKRPTDKNEIAFKMKTGEHPFALIKIGDISNWLKEELQGYELQNRFSTESYFEVLDKDDSQINILMGSRAFYEGWDSNRPNIITYINIGTGTKAKKFVLQSVGRGIRIEPLKHKRKRLTSLKNAKEITDTVFNKLNSHCKPLESLFIFGTSRYALSKVITELKQEGGETEKQISLNINADTKNATLLIPTYTLSVNLVESGKKIAKFAISETNLKTFTGYINYVQDDRVLLMKHNSDIKRLVNIRKSINKPLDYYNTRTKREYKNTDILAQSVLDYFNVQTKDVKEIKKLDNEIKHFKHIKVALQDITELQKKIEKSKDTGTREQKLEELAKDLQAGKITIKQHTAKIKEMGIYEYEEFDYNGRKLKIRNILNHYYLPVITSNSEKTDYIKHIIKRESEVRFLEDLEKNTNLFKNFDWWFFSKLDETLDEIYIPYYNPEYNRLSDFKPDFIFWFKKGQDYNIIFVDPKGTKHTDYEYKVDGFKAVFEQNDKPITFNYKDFKVSFGLRLYTADVNKLADNYKKHWFDSVGKLIS
jgi:hypothetical protein